MATKTFVLEHTHTTTDVYFIEAESEQEAEMIFRSGKCEPDDFQNYPDDDEIEISLPDDEVCYDMDED